MGDASVNGDSFHSATVDHINGYKFVQDLTEYYKSNPWGQKSIDVTSAAYGKVVKPVLPFFETPASYAKPYAVKIDEYGNVFLSKIDEKFPVLKAETKEVKEAVIAQLNKPLELANDTKTYVLDIYSEQYKECGGDGYVAGGKAIITSSLVLTSETLTWLSKFLSAKKEEAKETAKEAQEKASS